MAAVWLRYAIYVDAKCYFLKENGIKNSNVRIFLRNSNLFYHLAMLHCLLNHHYKLVDSDSFTLGHSSNHLKQ